MINALKNIDKSDYDKLFSDTEHCLKFLADYKWEDGFICRKCGNTHFCHGKTPHSRRCTRCKKEESARSHTFFHNCKIDLHEAFHIVLKVINNPQISTYALADEFGFRQMTCWRMKKLVENFKIDKKLKK